MNALKNLARFARNEWPKLAVLFTGQMDEFTARLRDQNKDVRIAAAEHLGDLGPEAKSALPALIAAAINTEKPTYSAPTALIRVDPFNPETIPALLKALENPDSIVRSAAAQALGHVGAFDERALSALIRESENGNADAVRALGQFGSAAEPAVPTLTKIAKEAPHEHLRQYARESLAKIGVIKREVVAMLIKAVEQPVGTYGRKQAIENLGELQGDAAPALPVLLKVIENQPTDYELYTLLETLGKMGAKSGEVKRALTSLLDHQENSVRERAAKYLVQIAPEDGAMLAKVLSDDSSSVIQIGCRSLTHYDLSALSEKAQVVAALDAIIKDETRYQDTVYYCAKSALARLQQ